MTATHFITFLRHGESVGNAAGYHQGQADFPLSETGIRQAQALADYWLGAGVVFDHVIASPLACARQTAEVIAGCLGLPVEPDALWMERNAGHLEGISFAEAEQRYPRPAYIPLHERIGGSGESQWELFLRAGQAVDGLLRRPAGRYLVVSHGALLNMVMYAILGITPQANFNGPTFGFHNTTFTTLRYDPEWNNWRLERFGSRPHWPEESA